MSPGIQKAKELIMSVTIASFLIFTTVVFPGRIFTLLHQEPLDAFRKFNESDLEFQWMQFPE